MPDGGNPGCSSPPRRANRPGAVRAAQVSAVLHHNEHDGTEGSLPSGRERSPRGEAVVSSP